MSLWARVRRRIGREWRLSRSAVSTPVFANLEGIPVVAVAGGVVAAADGGVDAASASSLSVRALTGPDEVLSAEALLARLYAHALGPAPQGLPAADPRHRDVQGRAAAVLARITAQPERLPRRPHLLPALMRATGSGDASATAIAALVQQDPTLTGNVLRIANSAYYALPGKPLESVPRAITRLGTEGMRRIVAASLMQPVTDGEHGAFASSTAVIWEHSLIAAAAAAGYARELDAGLETAAHMAALLHGLGSIVVLHAVRDEYARQPLLAPDPAVPLALLDSAGATAARIAASWGLPTPTVLALQATESSKDPLARLLQLGRHAAAAEVLVQAGALDEHGAATTLAALAGRPDAWSRWRRLLEMN